VRRQRKSPQGGWISLLVHLVDRCYSIVAGKRDEIRVVVGMRIFHAKLFDETLEGNGAFLEPSWPFTALLGRAESLKFFCVADQVVGAPTVDVTIYGGNAGDSDETTKSVINAPLSAGSNTLTGTYSPADPTYPPTRYPFVVVSISGAASKAHVALWVCGRGPQLIEALPSVSSTFADQYAAARMLADEDRLPSKKKVLRQGASVFYPPELFLPSLKWDR